MDKVAVDCTDAVIAAARLTMGHAAARASTGFENDEPPTREGTLGRKELAMLAVADAGKTTATL
jgi:hypothetical protein